MTITVSLNTLGILKATDILASARTDAARQHVSGPRVVSVDVGVTAAPATSTVPAGQTRVVDLIV